MSTVELPIPEVCKPLQPVRSLVVRHGYLRQIGEFPYDGPRPMCGAKVVIKTRRGTELAKALTTTCENTGCPQSVSRQQMTEYISLSGGRDYPFGTEGRVLRIANAEDLSQQLHLDQQKPAYASACKELIREMQLPMKLVDVEMMLGGETVTFYFLSEQRVDFRVLVKQLAAQFHTRIQMHQVGSRDEARVVADFETCGQECCCRQFLKVLKPISMGSAKMQKATLDPGKISGRCGRLKCCLRYEEENYEELRKKLPRTNTRVLTSEGAGVVLDTTILTQLVKVRLDNDRIVAVANDELLERDLKEGAPPRPQPAVVERRPVIDKSGQERPAAAEAPAPSNSAETPSQDRRRGRKQRRGGQPSSPGTAPAANNPAPPAQAIRPAPAAASQPASPAPAPTPPSGQPSAGMGTLGRRRRGRSRGRGGEPAKQ